MGFLPVFFLIFLKTRCFSVDSSSDVEKKELEEYARLCSEAAKTWEELLENQLHSEHPCTGPSTQPTSGDSAAPLAHACMCGTETCVHSDDCIARESTFSGMQTGPLPGTDAETELGQSRKLIFISDASSMVRKLVKRN